MIAAASRHPLRIPDFRNYVVTRWTMTLAQYAMVLIIGYQAYDLARSELGLGVQEASARLGLLGLLQFLPLFLLTPVTGWVADRYDRLVIARLTLLLQFACAVTLAAVTYVGAMHLPVLLGIAVLLGVARAFAGPAYSSIAPNLVPKAVLPTAIALSSIAWQTGAIVGPAIGGLAYAVRHDFAYWAAAGLFAIASLFLWQVKPLARRPAPSNARPLAQVAEGLRYVAGNKVVLGAITLDLFAVLLAGATALLPVYARDILRVGPTGLSQLAAAPAVGAAVVAIVFSIRPLKSNVGPKMLGAVVVFGLATVVFGLSTSMALSLGALGVAGAADMFSVYVRQSLIQLATPDDKRGRVSAVSGLTISASNELGEAESGFLAWAMGPVFAVVAGGAAAILITLGWAALFPALRRAKRFEDDLETKEATT